MRSIRAITGPRPAGQADGQYTVDTCTAALNKFAQGNDLFYGPRGVTAEGWRAFLTAQPGCAAIAGAQIGQFVAPSVPSTSGGTGPAVSQPNLPVPQESSPWPWLVGAAIVSAAAVTVAVVVTRPKRRSSRR